MGLSTRLSARVLPKCRHRRLWPLLSLTQEIAMPAVSRIRSPRASSSSQSSQTANLQRLLQAEKKTAKTTRPPVRAGKFTQLQAASKAPAQVTSNPLGMRSSTGSHIKPATTAWATTPTFNV
jgi:hypothetical protein